MKLCSVKGCKNPAMKRGWCEMHYARWKRHHNPFYTSPNPPTYGLICKFKNCNKSAYWRDGGKRSWCQIHYRRWQRHKNPTVCKYASDGFGCITKGYKRITVNGKYIFEHRHIMEQFLKRKLNRFEIIHHKNRNPLDNRIENLELITQSIHCKIHYNHKLKHF